MDPRLTSLNHSAYATSACHRPENSPCRARPAAGEGDGREQAAPRPGLRGLAAGHALTLRARTVSVLRISHGRVWLTLTHAGPWSRVQAGDHFLSSGESLTLLPGQALVMEPFDTADSAPAQFTWGEPGVAAAEHVSCGPALSPAAHWRGGVVEPLGDLRHAAGLAARATGRLVVGLGRLAGAALAPIGSLFAMILVAAGAGKTRASSSFDSESHASATSCRLS